MNKVFKSYQVWPKFPSVSMSGNICAFNCKHCNHIYLSDMQNLMQPEKLYNSCKKFADNGAVGFLLSGGCDKNGEMINLRKLLPTIKKIKDETNLIIKLHTGVVDKTLAEEIISAGIDIASVEIVGSNDSLNEIFRSSLTTQSYKNTLINLENAGMPFIVPHVCIGLHYGKLKGEFDALDTIYDNCSPSVIVMIIFRPTKGTELENCQTSSLQDISSVIRRAKEKFTNVDISLGCIRPRIKNRYEIEITAIDSGVTRMEIPSKKTIQYLGDNGYTVKTINACCALPEELENRAIDN